MLSTGERVIKDSREDSWSGRTNITDQFFDIFIISFSMPTTIMRIFTNSPDTIAAGRVFEGDFIFVLCLWDSLRFYECSSVSEK